MIILSNCLTDAADEGCRKVVRSLVRRIKKAESGTLVVSCGSHSKLEDRWIPVNKLMVSGDLAALLRQRQEPLLYLPAPAKMRSTAVRLFVLSWYARWGLRVILPMEFPVDPLSGWLIRASKAQIIALSQAAWQHYRQALGAGVHYLRTGVDTDRFSPVAPAKKRELRKKYGLPEDKPIVLHVGHLQEGRNIGWLTGISEGLQVVLVVSTQTADQQDRQLRDRLEGRPNIRILDSFLPDIEEIYQLSDVYFFPVEQAGHCIDVPLSALEAAACGIPVAATPYGELKELLGQEGFYRVESFEPEKLNALLRRLCREGKSPRESVMKYNWDLAVAYLLSEEHEKKEAVQ